MQMGMRLWDGTLLFFVWLVGYKRWRLLMVFVGSGFCRSHWLDIYLS